MSIGLFFQMLIISVFVNNFVLSQFLGICPYMGVSKRLDSAIGMGAAVIFVMTLASAIAWILESYFLLPSPNNIWFMLFGDGNNYSAFDFTYLRTIVFILSIAALVQLVETFMKKFTPAMYELLGIYLPLITTNCAILGVVLLNVKTFTSGEGRLLKYLTNALGAGLGFTLAIVIMAGIRERMDEVIQYIPKPLRGSALTFIIAGLLSLAFMGFVGF
ncbi:MAG: electron transport complex subunit RsxA [Candidatus Aureabacteria bacterium]|nr:electron transport complex subunit RsxA [Candidatus Auribacterota bacterium]